MENLNIHNIHTIHAFIPARGGSKRIPRKNIKSFAGKPLIAWSVEQGINSKYINKVILSTDDQEIAEIGEKWGATIPFLRPKNISEDLSTDFQAVSHYLNWCEKNNCVPDIIVHLRPTYPTRNVSVIDDAIEKFIAGGKKYTSLRSVVKNDKPAYKMYSISEEGVLNPLFKKIGDINEPYNCPAQLLPETYWHNGCLDMFWSDTILNENSITGTSIYPLVMNPKEVDDIDTIEEWDIAEKKFKRLNCV